LPASREKKKTTENEGRKEKGGKKPLRPPHLSSWTKKASKAPSGRRKRGISRRDNPKKKRKDRQLQKSGNLRVFGFCRRSLDSEENQKTKGSRKKPQ